mgnify:CR=1 FL=1|tara:strand:- start:527 stop:973 length:447 start_codon:yes stop_codon:yes gene_type:complete
MNSMDTVVRSPFLRMGDPLRSSMVKVSSLPYRQLTGKLLSAIMINWKIYFPRNMALKYNEDALIQELRDYIVGTYNQHYSAGNDSIQTLDLIEACGDAEAFCRGNILKYASRYDKKGTARRDIVKILHYGLLLLHFSDKNSVTETYNQ